MNFWKMINRVAWGLSILMLAVMFRDFFIVEKERKISRTENSQKNPSGMKNSATCGKTEGVGELR